MRIKHSKKFNRLMNNYRIQADRRTNFIRSVKYHVAPLINMITNKKPYSTSHIKPLKGYLEL